MWRSAYKAINARGEILHGQAQFWGQKGIHYHQFLEAGENTLNIKISRLLVDSLNENQSYVADDFLDRYILFMTTPNRHQDTYIEECHRNFFANYAAGIEPRKCGVNEKHIGGLSGIVPVVAFYADEPEKAREHALSHLALTHPGKKMETAASLIIDILLKVFAGLPLLNVILDKLASQDNPFMGHPFKKLLEQPDQIVVGRHFSTACYVEDAVPAVIYLALKYNQDPETALIVNTNLGGDNAGRGAVLGALLGAAHGGGKFPKSWLSGLKEPLPALLERGNRRMATNNIGNS